MNQGDIFALRLKLLVKMAKDCLDGYDFSPRCQRIILENARYIEMNSVELGHLNKALLSNLTEQTSVYIDDFFYRCAYDLAVQIKLTVKEFPLDKDQKSILQEILEALSVIWSTDNWKHRLSGLSKRFPTYHELENSETTPSDFAALTISN